jgi:hypothetical protein
MIVADETSDFLVITQTDHARFAGELLSLWRSDGLPDHPRRTDLLFAAREHDNGWREADAAPTLDPERGRPYDFLTLPDAERAEIWERGTGRFAERRPYAALLITLHAVNVLGGRGGGGRWQGLLARLAERREKMLKASGAGAGEAAADYRFIDLTDAMSLAVCNRWRDPFERGGMRGRFDREIHTLYLEPFPFAGATTFQVPVRRIPRRRYGGDADLGAALAAATWSDVAVRVAPLAEPEHLAGAATEPP